MKDRDGKRKIERKHAKKTASKSASSGRPRRNSARSGDKQPKSKRQLPRKRLALSSPEVKRSRLVLATASRKKSETATEPATESRGAKWGKVSDWIEPMKDKVRPMLEADAKAYADKNAPWPARTEACGGR